MISYLNLYDTIIDSKLVILPTVQYITIIIIIMKDLDLSTICTDVSDSEKEHTIYDLQSIVVHKGGYGSGTKQMLTNINIFSFILSSSVTSLSCPFKI